MSEPKLIAPDKTHCTKGHPLGGSNEGRVKHNTPYGKYITRVCRQCAKDYRQKRKAKLAERREPRATRKGELPSREELAALVGKHTWTALGLKYGVSDVAVRTWAKRYGLL